MCWFLHESKYACHRHKVRMRLVARLRIHSVRSCSTKNKQKLRTCAATSNSVTFVTYDPQHPLVIPLFVFLCIVAHCLQSSSESILSHLLPVNPVCGFKSARISEHRQAVFSQHQRFHETASMSFENNKLVYKLLSGYLCFIWTRMKSCANGVVNRCCECCRDVAKSFKRMGVQNESLVLAVSAYTVVVCQSLRMTRPHRLPEASPGAWSPDLSRHGLSIVPTTRQQRSLA